MGKASAPRLPGSKNSCIIGEGEERKGIRGHGLAAGREFEEYPLLVPHTSARYLENTMTVNHFPSCALTAVKITGVSAMIFNTRRFRRPFPSYAYR